MQPAQCEHEICLSENVHASANNNRRQRRANNGEDQNRAEIREEIALKRLVDVYKWPTLTLCKL